MIFVTKPSYCHFLISPQYPTRERDRTVSKSQLIRVVKRQNENSITATTKYTLKTQQEEKEITRQPLCV